MISLTQRLLLVVFFAALFVPSGNLIVNRLRFGHWGVDPRLSGVTETVDVSPATAHNCLAGSFQKEFTDWYATYFGQKRRLVTAYNWFLYKTFRVSHMYQDQIAIGPHEWLFENAYLEDYFNLRPAITEKALEERVDAIAELSQVCQKQKICFVVVISPSKASFHSEEAPDWFKQKGVRPERDYDRFVRLLAERNVPMVDAHQMLVAERHDENALPVFPRGGTHWNHFAAQMALEKVTACASAFFQKPLPTISTSNVHTDRRPTGSDTDLAELLNLPTPPADYPAVKFDYAIASDASAFRPRTVLAGSSFCWTLLDLCHTPEARLFRSIDYSYYHGEFRRWDDAHPWVEKDKYQVNSDKESTLAALKNCDMIILEMNEAGISLFDYSIRFCRDAVQQLQSSTSSTSRL